MSKTGKFPFGLFTGLAVATVLALGFEVPAASAQTACTNETTDLIAGRSITVGDVNVCNDDTKLTVTYEATSPWCLTETNLQVATSLGGIPQTKKGNPKPDEVDDGDVHDPCAGTATFEILIDGIGDGLVEPGETVYIAANAMVLNQDDLSEEGAWGEGPRFPDAKNWAMYFTYQVQASQKIVFVTSETFNGNLGGVDGAHAKCQAAAEVAGLPGIYKAWIAGTDPNRAPAGSAGFTRSTVSYVLPTGTCNGCGAQVADDFDDLTSCDVDNGNAVCLDHPINVDENALDVPSGSLAWTNVNRFGESSSSDSDFSCHDWTFADLGFVFGNVGSPDVAGDFWTLLG
jgi:hypothetical protein